VAKEKTEKDSVPAADGKEKPKPAKAAPASKKEKPAKPAPKAKRKREPFSPRRLLAPLVPLYKLALAIYGLLRFMGMWPTERLSLPVISIGNLSTGGSGKTPLAITLVKALTQRGVRVDVLSRGYGRQQLSAARVDLQGTAAEFGDEPLLIARETGVPVYVASLRFEAGLLAEADEKIEAKAKAEAEEKAKAEAEAREKAEAEARARGEIPAPPAEAATEADPEEAAAVESHAEEPEEPPPSPVHLLDDGFQHRQLARTVDILLLNQHDWNDWLLPAGNLREPLMALHRASVIAIPHDEPRLDIALNLWGWQGPIWHLRREMEIPEVHGPVAAFCGIARSEQFFDGLEKAGLVLARRFAFPDHYAYTPDLLQEMLAETTGSGVTAFVTTEKDLVRLGKLTGVFPKSQQPVAARLRVEIEDEESAIDWLVDRLGTRA
jgi:tetraacyldisaccharide 4'-kinase